MKKKSGHIYEGFIFLIHDVHTDGCDCSYCDGKTKLHYGLNIPKHWNSFVSWYVIKYKRNKYIKWTNPWFKWFRYLKK